MGATGSTMQVGVGAPPGRLARPTMAAEGLSDEALLAGLAYGDPEAGRAFVHRFQSRVFGLALTILRDPAMAEDIAQEAFLRAWKHGPTYDPRRGTVTAWLLRITRILAIDTLRLRRAEVMDPDVLTALAAPADVNVEDTALTREAAEAVRRVLQNLPEEQRRALLLAAFFGRTAEEISRLEAIPLGTAKTRIRLGLRRVRAMLPAPAEEA